MRRNKRHHTTLTRKTEVKHLRRGLLATLTPVLLSLVIPLMTANTVSASISMSSQNDPIWDLEVIWGEDLDGDGYIGPPPRKDPPPVGGGTAMFGQTT